MSYLIISPSPEIRAIQSKIASRIKDWDDDGALERKHDIRFLMCFELLKKISTKYHPIENYINEVTQPSEDEDEEFASSYKVLMERCLNNLVLLAAGHDLEDPHSIIKDDSVFQIFLTEVCFHFQPFDRECNVLNFMNSFNATKPVLGSSLGEFVELMFKKYDQAQTERKRQLEEALSEHTKEGADSTSPIATGKNFVPITSNKAALN